jgi:galactokinase/mevalonate kinase-like predicted kinase
MADIPAGTGLGSSGSFTTALLKALYSHRKMLIHPRELAEQACEIEINRLREPIGKQDQYIAHSAADLLPLQQGRQCRSLAAQDRCRNAV